MGRFWIDDDFIRIKAKNLSIYAIAIYTALCSYVNGKGNTFVGQRRLAQDLNISKNTVTKAIKELEASHLVGRSKGLNGQASQITLTTVPNQIIQPSHPAGHKEVFKEYIKEQKFILGNRGEYSMAKEKLREKWGMTVGSIVGISGSYIPS
jgi:DNA-binding MarR family transcriptional regulator